jgi:diguanylate cyclase (GGDEF)-like protein
MGVFVIFRNFGHDAGDAVLRETAASMFKNTRAGDRLVRWGGEEFTLFCVDTSAQKAQLIAEKNPLISRENGHQISAT